LECAFCGADFTLHERDLDTVCPKCLTRMSRRAKFCHHCGTALAPEHLAQEDTDLSCPVCGAKRQLTHRQIGDVAVMECGACAGLWLGTKPFEQLVRRASSEAISIDQFVASDRGHATDSARRGQQAGKGWRYRRCPVCGKMMNRRNYGRSSGVVIDTCRDHGIWFDADELPRILAWIRSGKKAKADRRRAEQAEREERIERRIAEVSAPRRAMRGGIHFSGGYSTDDPLGGFLDEIIEGLFGLR
jgi:Zn-finger nucleic acid-binding protein